VSSFEERRGDHDRRQDREGGSGRGRDRDERSAGRERRGTSGMGSHGERNRQSGGQDRQGTGGGRGRYDERSARSAERGKRGDGPQRRWRPQGEAAGGKDAGARRPGRRDGGSGEQRTGRGGERGFDRGRGDRSRDGEARSGARGAGRGDRQPPAGGQRRGERQHGERQRGEQQRGEQRAGAEAGQRRFGSKADRERSHGERDARDQRSPDQRSRDRSADRQPGERGQRRTFAGRGRQENDRTGGAPRRTPRTEPREDIERRPREPELPEDTDFAALDHEVRADLRGLPKTLAETVGRHLVAAGTLVDSEPERALEHARYARTRASRVAAVREANGLVAYHAGEWAEALAELRAARRMGGGPGHLAVMADCERALGRPERALEIAREARGEPLPAAEAVELRIVAAGARRDMGQHDAAVVALQGPDLDPRRVEPWSARLFYAYADNLAAVGRTDEALRWFLHAADADEDGETGAAERAFELAPDPDAVINTVQVDDEGRVDRDRPDRDRPDRDHPDRDHPDQEHADQEHADLGSADQDRADNDRARPESADADHGAEARHAEHTEGEAGQR